MSSLTRPCASALSPRGGPAVDVEAELLHDRGRVGDHPFAVDLVSADHAVGNGPRLQRAALCAAQMAVLRVPSRTGDEVGGVEPVAVVAVPDDWVAMPRRSGKLTSRWIVSRTISSRL